MTFDVDRPDAPVSRRDALRLTLAASLVVITGCQTTGRSSSELDSANEHLRRTLDGIAVTEEQQARLASVARHIERKARELLNEHREFLAAFDTMLIDPDVTPAELRREGLEFQTRRVALRNDLLHLQDELRVELTAAEWDGVVEALNRKAQSVGRGRKISRG